jgi:hypothetical protein
MLHARGLILFRPITRRGLIHQARYLAAQFDEHVDGETFCTHLPDMIGERSWPEAYLRSLAGGLRKMADEFPEQEGEQPSRTLSTSRC